MEKSSIRNLAIRLSVAGTSLYPLLACGLGLSDIQLESRLNQPLRARIEILDVSDEEWRQIHTRLNRESSPDMPAMHPEMLDGITLRVIEDGSHRHFVEMRSAAAVTEPLFDLPVEIAGPAGRIVRNYSVLLDPPVQADDARQAQAAQRSAEPQRATESQRAIGLQQTSGLQQTTAPHSNSNTHRRHKHHRHGSAHPSAAAARAASTQQPQPLPAGNDRAQTELAQQLGALQQMLAKMQETIAAQNAQIVDLTAKIAARSQPQPTYTSPGPAQTSQASPEPAQSPQATDTETDDADSTAPESRPHPYFWPVALGLTTTLTLLAAVLLWRRAKRSADQPPTEAHRDQSPSAQVPAEKDSPYRTRTGKSSPTPATTSSPATRPPPQRQPADGLKVDWHHDLWDNPDWQRIFGRQAKPETPETPLDAEKLPAAYLENPPKKDPRKAYSPELPEATTASASAETTKLADLDTTTLAELDAATLLEGDTARLPPVEESQAAKNVAQILQDSLANDPHRVDIRIKLLEIYHHEALGNRAEFNSVLNSLVADSRMLTPAQRAHVDKLQRTVGNEGSETTDLITKVAS